MEEFYFIDEDDKEANEEYMEQYYDFNLLDLLEEDNSSFINEDIEPYNINCLNKLDELVKEVKMLNK